jgi:dihydrofolate synthase/folylpolyglutamate synthase
LGDSALATFEALFGPEFGHGKAFDLARLRAALTALGSPQTKLPPVIHVAGTNGKGSTIAFMRVIAEAAGLHVHAFTKPHLFALGERFVIASEVANDAALIAAGERVAAADRALTQFDAQVAAAFLLFSETPADLVLLETGMGGRDDSTNVIEPPALSVITPIALDHQDVLGATLAEIAAHKAGILKPDVPGIIARQTDEAREIIEAEAARVGTPLLRQGMEWDAYFQAGRLIVQTETRLLDLPPPTLHGAHQCENAGLACAALMAWRAFDDSAFAEGAARARWPARLQALTRGALSAPTRAVGGEVWVDGGHNAHALAALAAWAATQQARRQAPLIVIFAARARKDWAPALKHLATIADCIIATPLREGGVQPAHVVAYARSEGARSEPAATLDEALAMAARFPAPRVLICGSFLLAAEALAAESA